MHGGAKPVMRQKGLHMKKELGIARCGLACCLCSENEHCAGCNSGECPDKGWCENRRCSIEKGLVGCFECDVECEKGLLGKTKPRGFTEFARKFGTERLISCLERNEKNGVVYHISGIVGDYDGFDDVNELLGFIENGKRN